MLIGLIETAGKSILATDPDSLSDLSALSGQIIAFEIQQLNKTLYLRPVEDGIEIELDSNLKPNVTFSAKLEIYLRLAKDGLKSAEYAPGELEISGDALLGQQFVKIIGNIDIDWEELLSQQIGDVSARLVSKKLQGSFDWVHTLSSQAQNGLTEILIDRTELLAKPDEVSAYLANVDDLESQTERLTAKLSKFEDNI